MINLDGDFGIPYNYVLPTEEENQEPGMRCPGRNESKEVLQVRMPEGMDPSVFPHALNGQFGFSVIEDEAGNFIILDVPESSVESVRKQIERCGLTILN